MDKLPSLPDPTAIQFWVGPGGHLLHYPMGHDHINFLLVERHPAPWPSREWVMPATEGEQLRHFAHWHPAVVEMITARPVSDRWGLFHRPPLGRWTRGRVTLLGDNADRRNARLQSPESALHHLGWIHEFDASTQEPSERQGGTWL
jgi:salicylate hydroxylase